MAKATEQKSKNRHRITSDGNSTNSKPKNKQRRRSFKAYRGQGKP